MWWSCHQMKKIKWLSTQRSNICCSIHLTYMVTTNVYHQRKASPCSSRCYQNCVRSLLQWYPDDSLCDLGILGRCFSRPNIQCWLFQKTLYWYNEKHHHNKNHANANDNGQHCKSNTHTFTSAYIYRKLEKHTQPSRDETIPVSALWFHLMYYKRVLW